MPGPVLESGNSAKNKIDTLFVCFFQKLFSESCHVLPTFLETRHKAANKVPALVSLSPSGNEMNSKCVSKYIRWFHGCEFRQKETITPTDVSGAAGVREAEEWTGAGAAGKGHS